jgi:hypothetical protein
MQAREKLFDQQIYKKTLLPFLPPSLCENSKTLCHTRGGGYPALMNPVRDVTIKVLIYI